LDKLRNLKKQLDEMNAKFNLDLKRMLENKVRI